MILKNNTTTNSIVLDGMQRVAGGAQYIPPAQQYLAQIPNVYFGCDPELFAASKDGKIMGSERVLPEHGLPGIVLDGVQMELNPTAAQCRANLANSITAAMRTLKSHLSKMKDVNACFDAVVTVDKQEMDRLSEKSKQFGCLPSSNFYDQEAKVKANATTYRKRSAGGHIHIGLSGMSNCLSLFEHRERLVPIFDTLIGNTCVMIDRDPHAAERRKNYGRAGEYRLPAHGIEYRTLSNFWLRSVPLMSLVMGLARMSVGVLNTTLLKQWDAEAELMQSVDLERIRTAINKNDLALAQKNWVPVRAFIAKHVQSERGWRQECGLHIGNLDAFEFFCKVVQDKGLTAWFPQDPLEHWCNMIDGHNQGAETFFDQTVKREMRHAGVC